MKNNKNNKNFRLGSSGKIANPYNSKSYHGQQIVELAMPGQPVYLTGAVTTGLIQYQYNVTLTSLIASQRVSDLFDEYRIVGVDMKVICGDPTSGVTVFLWDEATTGVPTGLDAQEKTHEVLSNNACNPKSGSIFKWRARDYKDLTFTSTSVSVTPVTFKVYTNNGTYGAGVAAGSLAQWYLEPTLYLEVRGIEAI